MILPELSLSKIETAAFPTGRYSLSPSGVSHLSEGCAASENLRMRLKEAYAGTAEEFRIIPSHPFAPLEGNVLHRLAKFYSGKTITDENEVFNRAEIFFNDERNKLIEKWSILNPRNVKFDFCKISSWLDYFMSKATKGVNTSSSGFVTTERNLNCSDSLGLSGVLDYLWINGNEAVIKDYKSGAILDSNGEVKQSYLLQLNLYRLMVMNKYPEIHIVKMYLEDFTGKTMQVEPMEDVILKEKIRIIRKNVEDCIYRPGENCFHCQCGHICRKKMWPNPSTEDYFEFMGKINISNNGIIVHHELRNLSLILARTDAISAIYNYLINLEGHIIYFSNLKKLSDNPLIATFSTSTVVCEIVA